MKMSSFFFFQAEDGIRDDLVTGVQTCALPISTFVGTSTPALITTSPNGQLSAGLDRAGRWAASPVMPAGVHSRSSLALDFTIPGRTEAFRGPISWPSPATSTATPTQP